MFYQIHVVVTNICLHRQLHIKLSRIVHEFYEIPITGLGDVSKNVLSIEPLYKLWSKDVTVNSCPHVQLHIRSSFAMFHKIPTVDVREVLSSIYKM